MKPPFEVKTSLSNDVQDRLSSGEVLTSFLFQHDVYIGEVGNDAADVFSVMILSSDRYDDLKAGQKYLVLPVVSQKILDVLFDEIVAAADFEHLRTAMRWEFEYKLQKS